MSIPMVLSVVRSYVLEKHAQLHLDTLLPLTLKTQSVNNNHNNSLTLLTVSPVCTD